MVAGTGETMALEQELPSPQPEVADGNTSPANTTPSFDLGSQLMAVGRLANRCWTGQMASGSPGSSGHSRARHRGQDATTPSQG
jgi:hypothetical protein